MKPDSGFFNRFSRVFKVKHWSFLFLVYSQSYCLYCLFTLERSYSPRIKGFQKWGSNSFRFQDTTKAISSKAAVPCSMPGRVVTLANNDLTDTQDVFIVYSGSSNWTVQLSLKSVVLRNSSENIVSSIVGIGSLVYKYSRWHWTKQPAKACKPSILLMFFIQLSSVNLYRLSSQGSVGLRPQLELRAMCSTSFPTTY